VAGYQKRLLFCKPAALKNKILKKRHKKQILKVAILGGTESTVYYLVSTGLGVRDLKRNG